MRRAMIGIAVCLLCGCRGGGGGDGGGDGDGGTGNWLIEWSDACEGYCDWVAICWPEDETFSDCMAYACSVEPPSVRCAEHERAFYECVALSGVCDERVEEQCWEGVAPVLLECGW